MPTAPSNPLEFQPIEHKSLATDVADLLRVRINAGDLEPGRLYALKAIAEQLGVSPTPVREAVLFLSTQGLVEVVRNRGFRVAAMNDQDLDRVVEIRAMLEPPAMRRVAGLDPRPDFHGYRTWCQQMEDAARDADLVEFVTLDKRFHLGLLDELDNPRLTAIVEQLRDQTRLSGLGRMAGTDALVHSAREHELLLDALEAGDGARAEAVMRTHLSHAVGLWSGRVDPDPPL